MNTKIKREIEKTLQSCKEDMYEYYIASKEGKKFNKDHYDSFMRNELDDAEFTRREDQAYILGKIDVLDYLLRQLEEKIKDHEIEIDLTELDLQELLEGEDFHWEYDGVKVHLFNADTMNDN